MIVDVSESVRGVLRPSDVVARTRPAELAVLASGAGEPLAAPGAGDPRGGERRAAGPERPAVALTVSLGAVPGREPRYRRAVRRRGPGPARPPEVAVVARVTAAASSVRPAPGHYSTRRHGASLHLPQLRQPHHRDRAQRRLPRQARGCAKCGFGFLFELLDDYYPAPDAAFFACDQQGNVIACGRGSFELTGLDDEKVIGRPVRDVLGLQFANGDDPVGTVAGVGRAQARASPSRSTRRAICPPRRPPISSRPTMTTAACCSSSRPAK